MRRRPSDIVGAVTPLTQPCPWEEFDAAWYEARYMRRGLAFEPTDPRDHYRRIGALSGFGPNPYFDEKWYLERYPDVRSQLGRGGFSSGFAHYRTIGYLDRDPHWLFNEALYRRSRADLSNEVLLAAGLRNGYHHYLIAGQNETLSGSPFFDAVVFAETTGISENPFTALLETEQLGRVRLSRHFDEEWYLSMYEDAANQVASGIYSSGLNHYLVNPTPSRYQGSADFDENFYRTRYPDVVPSVETGLFRNFHLHFLHHGRFEDRQPSPWFDPVYYRTHRQVISDLAAGLAATAFDHHLAFGKALGLGTLPPVYLRRPNESAATEPAGKDIFARMAHVHATALLCGGGAAGIAFAPPPADAAVDVSVVIAVFNQFDTTVQTLLSLSGNTGIVFEVILIDNASRDEVRRIERHVSGMTVLRNSTNEGFLHASNQGMAVARGRLVLLLNNDVVLPPNALRLAARRLLSDPGIGAVGAKVVRTHGLLQEAGCMLFRDGSSLGYGRDREASGPEFNFVRDVDYCSGVFLMVRAALMRDLGGFDPVFAPAYYEETDLCARLWQRGFRVVYDPAVVVVHLEYGSSRNPDAPRAAMLRNRALFVSRHREWLATKMPADAGMALHGRIAAGPGGRRRRVLVVEDTIPYRHLGSGFVRSADVVASLVRLGWLVTVLPMNPDLDTPANPREGFDETVELLTGHDLRDAPRVFAERETLYDVVWVCRAHNLHRLASVLGGTWGPLRHARVVLDTEALACNREAALAALDGRLVDTGALLRRELDFAHLAHDLVVVNDAEAGQLRDFGIARVHTLGHAMAAVPSARPFGARADILALGSLYSAETPNFDGLRWFIDKIWPMISPRLPGARLLVAGFVAEGLDVAGLLAGPGVAHLGFVPDAAALYDAARLFLAPTRFSAGIPYKVHEAAAHGLPVVATSLLAGQLGWHDGADLLACDPEDEEDFADAVVRAYQDESLWCKLREGALRRIDQDCSQTRFDTVISGIVNAGSI